MSWKYRGHEISQTVVINYLIDVLKKDLSNWHVQGIQHWLNVGPEQYRKDLAISPKNREILMEVQTWMAMFALKLRPIRGVTDVTTTRTTDDTGPGVA